MTSRVRVVSLVLALLVVALPLHAAGQSMAEWRSFARGQVERIWRELERELGFGYTGQMRVGALSEGDDQSFTVELLSHREYVIAGFCDDDCNDLDLLLYDANDNVVLADELTDDEPVINVPQGYGGTFTLEPVMASCSVEPCYWAVQVFHRYPGSP